MDGKEKFGHWIAMVLIGGISGAGGTFVLEGAISPGSTNIGVRPGWGTVTCFSVSTTFTLLVNVLGMDARSARTIVHVLNVMHWSSKAYGQPINMYAWLHWLAHKIAPYDQLKHKNRVLTQEELDKIDWVPKMVKK